MKKKKMSPYHKTTSPEEINICLNCELTNCKWGICDKVKDQMRKKKGR